MAAYGTWLDGKINRLVSDLQTSKKKLSADDIEEKAKALVALEVDGLLRWKFWEVGGRDKKSGLPTPGQWYVVVKTPTGDPMKDQAPHRGARRVLYQNGKVMEYDEDGKLI